MNFDFKNWRREIEKAIARGEAIPIGVLLDEAERAFTDLEAESTQLSAILDGEPE